MIEGSKHKLESRQKMSASKQGYCPDTCFKKGHQGFWKDKKNPYKTDERHHNWKGDFVSYNSLHQWVSRKLGTPNECERCETTASKFHWANIYGKYKRDLSDWVRLCQSCHFKMDKVAEKSLITRRERML